MGKTARVWQACPDTRDPSGAVTRTYRAPETVLRIAPAARVPLGVLWVAARGEDGEDLLLLLLRLCSRPQWYVWCDAWVLDAHCLPTCCFCCCLSLSLSLRPRPHRTPHSPTCTHHHPHPPPPLLSSHSLPCQVGGVLWWSCLLLGIASSCPCPALPTRTYDGHFGIPPLG